MRTVTFGEIMLRLNPEGCLRLVQADRLTVSYVGAEANVAVMLSVLGNDARFVTKLPKNEIGQAAVNCLRRYGTDCSEIVFGGERVGVLFSEKGAGQRSGLVIYDRKNSSFANAVSADFDWDEIFDGFDAFHFSGITPALGSELPQILLDACRKATEHKMFVSCDLNYRSKLWSTYEAGQVMSQLCPYVDLLVVNETQACEVFRLDIPGDPDIVGSRAEGVVEKLTERFGLHYTAVTLRRTLSADDNIFSGMLFDGKKLYASKQYKIHIVDRIGSGDAFCGGLLYGLSEGFESQKTVNFAAAAGALNHSIESDFNLISAEEILAMMNSRIDGCVQR